MRVHKSVPMLAAAATLLTAATPASAFYPEAPAGGTPSATPAAVSHPAGSSDLALELAAGGVVLAGGGLAAIQLRRRFTHAAHRTRVASGS